MIVLALDTSLSATALAVLDGDQVLAIRAEPMERGHSERVAGLVRDGMAEAGVAFSRLSRIGVTVGPGSFTGLRVGLAFAKGLALALNVPCVGIGSLEALAAGVGQSELKGELVAAAIDARRGQVYLQLFKDGAPITPPEALSIADAQARLNQVAIGLPPTLIGSGARLLAPDAMSVDDVRTFPDPVNLARLTAAAREPIARPAPLYLRAPDAKTIAERAAAR